MFTIQDTFNGKTVSAHRTLEAAVKAQRKFLFRTRRANGPYSYIPTEILCNGARLTEEQADQLCDIRIALDAV